MFEEEKMYYLEIQKKLENLLNSVDSLSEIYDHIKQVMSEYPLVETRSKVVEIIPKVFITNLFVKFSKDSNEILLSFVTKRDPIC